MTGKSIKSKAASGIIWTSVEKIGLQAMQLVIGIAIARILSPDDYGIVGMTAIFTAVAQTLLDSGFGSALIQKKDRNEADYSTCFYFNILVGAGLYALLFFAAPYIAAFYRTPLLTPVCRVVALSFLFNSLTISQTAKLTVELKFKQLAIISLLTYVGTGAIGLTLALRGWGIWALVFQIAGSAFFRFILIELYTRWLPVCAFSRASFSHLFAFGSKILVSSLINTIYNNIHTLVIGRAYTPGEVGLYNRANQFAILAPQVILDTVMKVAYPLMSEVQDDEEKLCRAYRKFLRAPLFLLCPVLAGLIALADPFILVILGEKWQPCVPFLQILCIGAIFIPLTHINLNLLYVKGRTDLVLKLEVIKKSFAFTILFATIPLGIFWLIAGKALYDFVAYTFNCYYTGRFIRFGFWRQMSCMMPILIRSAIMGGACYWLASCFSHPASQLAAGICGGILIYGILSVVSRDECIYDVIELLKSRKTKK